MKHNICEYQAAESSTPSMPVKYYTICYYTLQPRYIAVFGHCNPFWNHEVVNGRMFTSSVKSCVLVSWERVFHFLSSCSHTRTVKHHYGRSRC